VNARPDIADPDGVRAAVRDRMRELGMSISELSRRSGLSQTTIRSVRRTGQTNRAQLVAVSAALRWRFDYLTNIASGEPEKNVRINPPASVLVERVLRAEIDPLKEQVRTLQETLAGLASKLAAENTCDPAARPRPEAPVASLPAVDDMDADYSPQYVRLARRVRARIESGALRSSDQVLTTDLAAEYGVSEPVAWAALRMLSANGYVRRPDRFRPYEVTDRWAAPGGS